MNECYFSQCSHHEAHHYPPEDSEPFCMLDKCVQPTEILEKWGKERHCKKDFTPPQELSLIHI